MSRTDSTPSAMRAKEFPRSPAAIFVVARTALAMTPIAAARVPSRTAAPSCSCVLEPELEESGCAIGGRCNKALLPGKPNLDKAHLTS